MQNRNKKTNFIKTRELKRECLQIAGVLCGGQRCGTGIIQSAARDRTSAESSRLAAS